MKWFIENGFWVRRRMDHKIDLICMWTCSKLYFVYTVYYSLIYYLESVNKIAIKYNTRNYLTAQQELKYYNQHFHRYMCG